MQTVCACYPQTVARAFWFLPDSIVRFIMRTRMKRLALIAGGVLLLLFIASVIAFQFAIRAMKSQVESALGPHGEVKEIRVSLTGVEIIGLRIRASDPSGGKSSWPAEDELRADRVVVVPSLNDLVSAKVVLESIRVEGAYVSMLRTREGKLLVLPSLLQQPKKGNTQETAQTGQTGVGAPVTINHIELTNGTIEFYDATLRKTPVKQRIEHLDASLGQIRLPDLTGKTTIKLTGTHKGVQQDGRIALSGAIELATKECGLSAELKGVDLVSFQPYLIKAADTGVKRGSLDLDLNASVKKGILHAPGQLTLSSLELSSSSGSIMGLPRSAAISLMKNRKGKIVINFSLDGNINDPHFSLNENLMTKITASFANSLGISVESLAKGVESVGGGIVEGIGKTLGIGKKK